MKTTQSSRQRIKNEKYKSKLNPQEINDISCGERRLKYPPNGYSYCIFSAQLTSPPETRAIKILIQKIPIHSSNIQFYNESST